MDLLAPDVQRIAPEENDPSKDRVPDELASGHPGAAAQRADRAARAGSGPDQGHRPGSLRLRREPLPPAPEGRRDGARRRTTSRRSSPSAGEMRCRSRFRAGGTSLNGQSQSDGILVDVRRHWSGVEVLDDGARVRVKPGTVLGHANRVLAPLRAQARSRSRQYRHRLRRRRARQQLGRHALRYRRGLLQHRPIADLRAALRDRDRHSRAGRRRALRAGRARPGEGPRRDPGRDPRRRRAQRADPEEVPDQEHHRLPALRLPRRGRAASRSSGAC